MLVSECGFTFFDTEVGLCGIVWTPAGVAGVQLPERNQTATRALVSRRFPRSSFSAPPPDVEAAIDGIRSVIAGQCCDLATIRLDLKEVADWDRRVYEVTRSIPFGTTLTYGEVAARVGDRDAARAVGQSLGRNPFPIIVPCHRVVAAGTRLGGFSASGGIGTKERLLRAEGVLKAEQTSLF